MSTQENLSAEDKLRMAATYIGSALLIFGMALDMSSF
ncbi:hypothetical protein N836_30045 [Leptolyngbya sp. Heron Island J]|nr:hypothetical protein N836_30045 [Leptolyngbya sp. Heron Island J]